MAVKYGGETMAVTLRWLMDKMEAWAPLPMAEAWDNVGLLIGDPEETIKKVLVALDASEAVVQEAADGGFDALLTHHPLIFKPVSRITAENALGRKILTLARHHIALYAAHTNLDMAEGGPNDLLFERLSLTQKSHLMEPETDPSFALGRTGFLPEPMTLADFAAYVAARLGLDDLRYAGPPDRLIRKVGLCAGDASALPYLHTARQKNCDVFITGDLRYHATQELSEMGLALLDITHYAGEAPLVGAVVDRLQSEATKDGADITFTASCVNGQVFQAWHRG